MWQIPISCKWESPKLTGGCFKYTCLCLLFSGAASQSAFVAEVTEENWATAINLLLMTTSGTAGVWMVIYGGVAINFGPISCSGCISSRNIWLIMIFFPPKKGQLIFSFNASAKEVEKSSKSSVEYYIDCRRAVGKASWPGTFAQKCEKWRKEVEWFAQH